MAANRCSQHFSSVSNILRNRHGCLLPWWSPKSRKGCCLLYHVCHGLLRVQYYNVACRCYGATRHKSQFRRPRHLGLVLQGQQTKTTISRRSSLRPSLPSPRLVLGLLHHRDSSRDHCHCHLRRRLLPILLQEPVEKVHGRTRQSPIRSLPSTTPLSIRTKHTWFRAHTTHTTLPDSNVRNQTRSPLRCRARLRSTSVSITSTTIPLPNISNNIHSLQTPSPTNKKYPQEPPNWLRTTPHHNSITTVSSTTTLIITITRTRLYRATE